MLLPAAGLIIAAAPATERRRCRGRPPFPCPPFSGRHSGSPFQANFRNSVLWGAVRGPFTLEVHPWPFCGNGVGPEITPFTPESLRHPLTGELITISLNKIVYPDIN